MTERSRNTLRLLAAFRASADADWAVLRNEIDACCVFIPPCSDPHPQPCRGFDAFLDYRQKTWGEAWESLEFDVLEVVEDGSRLLAYVRERAKASIFGAQFDVPPREVAYLITLRDDRAARVEMFYDKEQALRALSHAP